MCPLHILNNVFMSHVICRYFFLVPKFSFSLSSWCPWKQKCFKFDVQFNLYFVCAFGIMFRDHWLIPGIYVYLCVFSWVFSPSYLKDSFDGYKISDCQFFLLTHGYYHPSVFGFHCFLWEGTINLIVELWITAFN